MRRLLFVLQMWWVEWWHVLTAPIGWLRTGSMTTRLARDSRDIATGSTAMATGLGRGLIGLLWIIVYSPLHLIYLPRYGWYFSRSRTWPQLALFAAIAVGGIAGAGFPAYHMVRYRQRHNLIDKLQSNLDQSLTANNWNDVVETLHTLVKTDPDDAIAARRLEAVQTLEAPANDGRMIRLLMHYQREHGRMDLAVREATKLIADLPNDWEARCILLEHGIRNQDQESIREQLQMLPSAFSVPRGLGLPQRLYALGLFSAVKNQEKLDDLLEYVWRRLISFIKADIADKLHPFIRLQFIELYDFSMQQIASRPALMGYWVPVQQLAQSIVQDEKSGAIELEHIGRLSEKQILHLQELRRLQLIDANEHEEFRKELEARLEKIWGRLHELDEKNVTQYQGMAMHYMRVGQTQEALKCLESGLKTVGPVPVLVETTARILQQHDPQKALQFLAGTLQEDKLTVESCQVLAEAGLANGRLDVAQLACQRALSMKPDLIWACRISGDIAMRQDHPSEAAAFLGKLKPILWRDPPATAVYVKALCDCGRFFLAEQFLLELIDGKRSPPSALAGINALKLANQNAMALQLAQRLYVRFPTDNTVALCLAVTIREQAEQPDGSWNKELGTDALQLYRRVLLADSKNLAVVNDIAWIELTMQDRADAALATAKPMVDRQNDRDMPAPYLETLGAIYLGNQQYEPARKCFERAIQLNKLKASYWIYLADAHAGLRQRAEAERCLAKARELQKSPRDLILFTGVEKRLQKS